MKKVNDDSISLNKSVADLFSRRKNVNLANEDADVDIIAIRKPFEFDRNARG